MKCMDLKGTVQYPDQNAEYFHLLKDFSAPLVPVEVSTHESLL